MIRHNERMNLSHETTVVFNDRQMQVRRCAGCRNLPYQLWRREHQSDPLIDSFHATTDDALTALMARRAAHAHMTVPPPSRRR